jgi:hypothetical protein
MTTSIVLAKECAPLQLWDDVVDELFEGVRQERRRDDEPIAGFRLDRTFRTPLEPLDSILVIF